MLLRKLDDLVLELLHLPFLLTIGLLFNTYIQGVQSGIFKLKGLGSRWDEFLDLFWSQL
jgi:hypothetical protein